MSKIGEAINKAGAETPPTSSAPEEQNPEVKDAKFTEGEGGEQKNSTESNTNQSSSTSSGQCYGTFTFGETKKSSTITLFFSRKEEDEYSLTNNGIIHKQSFVEIEITVKTLEIKTHVCQKLI